jgi:hypothetical protein
MMRSTEARTGGTGILLTLRRASRFTTALALLVASASACAVGTGLDDGTSPDTSSGGLPDAGADTGAQRDATTLADDAGDDGSTASPDTAPPPDAGTTPDTGTRAEAGADTGPSTCAAAGFSGALLKWNLVGQSGSETSAAATTTAAGVTGTALTRGGALSPAAGADSINSTNWPGIIDATRFYTFTVTPAAGCTVTLTSLAVDLSASGTGPTKADVATSIDAFAAHRPSVNANATSTITLPGVSGTGAIEVRVYGYGASGAGGTFRIQNTLTLTGTLN